jgi:hypothetical protein
MTSTDEASIEIGAGSPGRATKTRLNAAATAAALPITILTDFEDVMLAP